MSEENIEQQNDITSYSKVKDDNLKDNNLHLDNCSVSITGNCLNNSKLANTCTNNSLKTTTIFTNTNNSNNKLVDNNILYNASQLNNSECKYIIKLCSKNDIESANMNSQDEKMILKIAEKNLKSILSSTTGEIDINTQQFIDLNLQKAILQLQQCSQYPDICKNQSIEHMDLDDSITIKSLMLNEIKNVEENIVLTDKDLILSNHKEDLKLLNQEQNTKLLNEDQHHEIIAFRAMCESLIKIGNGDNNMELDNKNSTVVVDNQIKQIICEQENIDELKCINYEQCKPSTSKFTSATPNLSVLKDSHNLKRKILHKKDQCSSTLYLSNDSSSDCSNELLPCEYECWSKRIKYTKKQNKYFKSKLYSNKIIKKSNISNKIDSFVLSSSSSSSEDEELLNKNKKFRKVEPIFRCSPYGIIHADMLKSIKKKKKKFIITYNH